LIFFACGLKPRHSPKDLPPQRNSYKSGFFWRGALHPPSPPPRTPFPSSHAEARQCFILRSFNGPRSPALTHSFLGFFFFEFFFFPLCLFRRWPVLPARRRHPLPIQENPVLPTVFLRLLGRFPPNPFLPLGNHSFRRKSRPVSWHTTNSHKTTFLLTPRQVYLIIPLLSLLAGRPFSCFGLLFPTFSALRSFHSFTTSLFRDATLLFSSSKRPKLCTSSLQILSSLKRGWQVEDFPWFYICISLFFLDSSSITLFFNEQIMVPAPAN